MMNYGRKPGLVPTMAASLALLGLPALAGGHPDRAKLDTNGDGAVDLAEMQAAHPDFTAEKFNAADGDGSLTLAEMQKKRPELTQDEFTAHDADRDGKVTKEELRKSFDREKFARLDTDGNGQLSPEEFRAGHHKRD